MQKSSDREINAEMTMFVCLYRFRKVRQTFTTLVDRLRLALADDSGEIHIFNLRTPMALG